MTSTYVTLPVFIHSDETWEKYQQGLKFSIEDCEEVDQDFYQITAIRPYRENGIVYARISYGADTIISPWPPEKVKEAVEKVFPKILS